jgi:hypothetical protein
LQITLPSLKEAGKPEESYDAVVVGACPAELAALEIRSHMELERRGEP